MTTISALPAAGALSGTEPVILVQGGAAKKAPIGDLIDTIAQPYVDAAEAAATAAEGLVTGLDALRTAHPVPAYIGTPGDPVDGTDAAANSYAFLTVFPSGTVLDDIKIYMHASASITIKARTPTNISGGLLTASSTAPSSGPSVTIFCAAGLVTITAAELAGLGDVSGKVLIFEAAHFAYTSGAISGLESWAVLPADGSTTANIFTTLHLQIRINYHNSYTYSLDFTGADVLEGLAQIGALETATGALNSGVMAGAIRGTPATRVLPFPVSPGRNDLTKGVYPAKLLPSGVIPRRLTVYCYEATTITVAAATSSASSGGFIPSGATLTQGALITKHSGNSEWIEFDEAELAKLGDLSGKTIAIEGAGVYLNLYTPTLEPLESDEYWVTATNGGGAASVMFVEQLRLLYLLEYDSPVTEQTVDAAAVAAIEAEIGRDRAWPKPAPRALANPFPTPASSLVFGIVIYGQSLAGGSIDTLTLHTSQPYNHLTFGSGPRSAKPGNSHGALLTSPGTTTAIPLVEVGNADGAVYAGSNAFGETACSGLANALSEIAAEENGVTPDALRLFASSAARGAYKISQLKKGTGWYQQLLDHISEANARVTALGKTYKLVAVPWLQGESDAWDSTTGTAYYTDLYHLVTDIDADARAITGQTEPVRVALYQTPANVVDAANTLDQIRDAQYRVARDHPLAYLVAPGWHLPARGDRLHFTAWAQAMWGHLTARTVKQVLVDQIEPECLWPLSATARGTTLTLRFRVPTPPLVFDPALLGIVANQGIKVVDGTGTLTLSNIAIGADGQSVTMTLNRVLGTNPNIRVGLDYSSDKSWYMRSTEVPLRDSSQHIAVFGDLHQHLHHVCPSFEMAVVKLG